MSSNSDQAASLPIPLESVHATRTGSNQLICRNYRKSDKQGNIVIVTLNQLNFVSTIQLLTDLCRIFVELQHDISINKYNEINSSVDSGLSDKVAEFSKRYRAELQLYLTESYTNITQITSYRSNSSINLNKDSVQLNNELLQYNITTDEFIDQLLVLEASLSVLQLIEIIFIESSDNGTKQLVDWYQRSTPAAVFDSNTLVIGDSTYWLTVDKLICAGRLYEAVQLLSQHSTLQSTNASIQIYYALVSLIESIPTLNMHNVQSIDEFYDNMAQYRQQCDKLISTATTTDSLTDDLIHDIATTLRLLSGDEQIIQDVCDTFLELFIARLILVTPELSKNDYAEAIHTCISVIHNIDTSNTIDIIPQLSALEQIYYNVFTYKISDTIALVQSIFELPYMTAHLVDLLYNAHVLHHVIDQPEQLREQYITDYIYPLLSNSLFYPIGLQYSHCCSIRSSLIHFTVITQTSLSLDKPDTRATLIETIQQHTDTDNTASTLLNILHSYTQHDIYQLSALYKAIQAIEHKPTYQQAHEQIILTLDSIYTLYHLQHACDLCNTHIDCFAVLLLHIVVCSSFTFDELTATVQHIIKYDLFTSRHIVLFNSILLYIQSNNTLDQIRSQLVDSYTVEAVDKYELAVRTVIDIFMQLITITDLKPLQIELIQKLISTIQYYNSIIDLHRLNVSYKRVLTTGQIRNVLYRARLIDDQQLIQLVNTTMLQSISYIV